LSPCHHIPAILHLHSFPTRRSSDLTAPLGSLAETSFSTLTSGIPPFSSERTSASRSKPPGSVTPSAERIAAESADLNDWITASGDRKSTRLNSSHVKISYAVFCLKK